MPFEIKAFIVYILVCVAMCLYKGYQVERWGFYNYTDTDFEDAIYILCWPLVLFFFLLLKLPYLIFLNIGMFLCVVFHGSRDKTVYIEDKKK